MAQVYTVKDAACRMFNIPRSLQDEFNLRYLRVWNALYVRNLLDENNGGHIWHQNKKWLPMFMDGLTREELRTLPHNVKIGCSFREPCEEHRLPGIVLIRIWGK